MTSERLELRLPPELRATLKAAAKTCSLSLSGYVRDRLTQAAKWDLGPDKPLHGADRIRFSNNTNPKK